MIGSASASRADRHVQAHRGRVEAARRGQIGAEEIDGVGDLERRCASRRLRSASPPSGWRRRTCRPGRRRCRSWTTRLTCATGTSCSSTIQTGRPLRQLALLNGRQLQRRGGSRRRRLAAVRRLRSERRRGHQESDDESASIHSRELQHEVTNALRGACCRIASFIERVVTLLRHNRQLDAPVRRQERPTRPPGRRTARARGSARDPR